MNTLLQRTAKHVARHRGVVIIMAMLGLILMASLVFYVFNIGRNVQGRVVTQNAADAAAIGGATQVARALNTVAMNNVEMGRLVSAINLLDATDEALHPSYQQARAFHDAFDTLYPSAGGGLSAREADFIRAAMDRHIDDYQHDLEQMEPVKQIFLAPALHAEYRTPSGSLDVQRFTMYSGPAGRGQMWRAMEALDLYSQSVMASLPETAQLTAAQSGRVNLTEREPGGQAVLTPVLPDVPWERRVFDDFQRPVEDGLLPADVDHKQYRRGPFDTIFGWRQANTEREVVSPGRRVDDGVRVIPPTDGNGPSGPGGVGPPSNPGSTQQQWHWDPAPVYRTTYTGYRMYGIQNWLQRQHHNFNLRRVPMRQLRDTFAKWKLEMLWHGRRDAAYPFTIFLSDWNDITAAGASLSDNDGTPTNSAAAPNRRLVRTHVFVARLESEVSPDAATYLTPGTFTILDGRGRPTSQANAGRIVSLGGDWDVPAGLCAPLGAGFGNDPRHWQEVLNRFIAECPRYARLDPTLQAYWLSARFENLQGSDWRKSRFVSEINRDGQTIWQVMYYFVLTMELHEELDVRNPYNFTDRGNLPAPIDFVHQEIAPLDEQAKRDRLTFLGTAQQTNAGLFWGTKFRDAGGYPRNVAIAQAQVFNNHSWDMWTQMWHARLVPVTDFADWAQRMDDGRGNAGVIPGMSDEDYNALADHFANTEPVAGTMLQH